MTWDAKYIGIPFIDTDMGGRAGTNCWGIVRLIYLEQKQITLPGYDGKYGGIEDLEGLDKMAAIEIERSWNPTLRPQPFDLITTRWGGGEAHVGVIVNRQDFIHTRKGIESELGIYTSVTWRNRVVGFYRYVAK